MLLAQHLTAAAKNPILLTSAGWRSTALQGNSLCFWACLLLRPGSCPPTCRALSGRFAPAIRGPDAKEEADKSRAAQVEDLPPQGNPREVLRVR